MRIGWNSAVGFARRQIGQVTGRLAGLEGRSWGRIAVVEGVQGRRGLVQSWSISIGFGALGDIASRVNDSRQCFLPPQFLEERHIEGRRRSADGQLTSMGVIARQVMALSSESASDVLDT